MSTLAFTDQTHRLRMIVSNALDGTTFVASRSEENGRHLVIEGRRADGRLSAVRFRAVSDAEATSGTEVGVPLKLRDAQAGPTGCLPLGWLIPALRGIPRGVSRVRIDAGGATLNIVCQDAEWWEDEVAPGGVP
jgi:hypothetical protein